MNKIQIGTVLYENKDTTTIYKKYKDYFRVDDDKEWFVKYIISKEPSQELIEEIESYYKKFKERNKKHDDFVKSVANEVYVNLSQEDKDYIFLHPDSTEHHFGLGLGIRNKYIHGKTLDFEYSHADNLSSEITAKIASLIIDNYDYENPFYRDLYDSYLFNHLRRLYFALNGEYPDEIMDQYADHPDYSVAAEKVEKIVRDKILDPKRFKRLSRKHHLTDKQYSECKDFVDEYNKKDCQIVPYDIALLTSRKLEPDFRQRLLCLLKAVLDQAPRIALNMPAYVFNQRDAVLIAVGAMGTSLKRFPKYNADDEIIRAAIADNGEAIQYVKKELRDTPQYVQMAVQHYSFVNGLSMRCMIKYRDNEEILRLALAYSGYNMQYASDRLKDDFDTALFAISHQSGDQGPGVVHYLSSKLRDNIEIILADIKSEQAEIDSYSSRLKDSDQVAEALISTNLKWKLYQMSERIQKKYYDID